MNALTPSSLSLLSNRLANSCASIAMPWSKVLFNAALMVRFAAAKVKTDLLQFCLPYPK